MMTFNIKASLCAAALTLSFAAAPMSSAQSGQPWGISPSKDNSYADIGGAVLIRPNFLGSEETITSAYPYINAEYRGRLYLKPGLGAGLYVVNTDNFRINLGADYEFGRDAETINGFKADQIDSSVTANIGARYITPVGAFEAQLSMPVTGDLEGERLDIAYIIQFDPSETLRINPGARLSLWSEERINQFYASAPTTKLPGGRFEGEGTQSASVFVGAFWKIAKDYEIVGLVDYAALTGDLKDSALVTRDTGFSVSVALARKF